MKENRGIIVRLLGGFYYVDVGDSVIECKARGIFRKRGLSPVVGDNVVISIEKEGYAAISEVLPRKNSIVRPAVANIDKLFIVSSVCEPEPNLFIIDKMTATAFYKNIEPVIIFSKSDMMSADKYMGIYEKSGIKAVSFSTKTGEGAEEVRDLLKDSVVAFTGNSGVGKSSLLNYLFPALSKNRILPNCFCTA